MKLAKNNLSRVHNIKYISKIKVPNLLRSYAPCIKNVLKIGLLADLIEYINIHFFSLLKVLCLFG